MENHLSFYINYRTTVLQQYNPDRLSTWLISSVLAVSWQPDSEWCVLFLYISYFSPYSIQRHQCMDCHLWFYQMMDVRHHARHTVHQRASLLFCTRGPKPHSLSTVITSNLWATHCELLHFCGNISKKADIGNMDGKQFLIKPCYRTRLIESILHVWIESGEHV